MLTHTLRPFALALLLTLSLLNGLLMRFLAPGAGGAAEAAWALAFGLLGLAALRAFGPGRAPAAWRASARR